MLTILLLAVATAATATCAHLWIENVRLRAENLILSENVERLRKVTQNWLAFGLKHREALKHL